jgi:hypothetical protein
MTMAISDYPEARAAAKAYRNGCANPATAEATARQTLRACRTALEVLVTRLVDAGFPDVGGVLERATPAQINAVTATIGARPPRVLEIFWEEVGGIELVDFANYWHVKFFENRGIKARESTDALVVDGLSEQWLEFLAGSVDGWGEDSADDDDDSPTSFVVPLAPDHYHKDNVSGGMPYGVAVGDDDWFPRLAGPFAWVGADPVLADKEPDFVSYLRAAILECGGFPGLLGVAEFESLRRMLTAGLPVF